MPSAPMPSAGQMRFERATYGEAPVSLVHCGFCGRGIDTLAYEIAGRPACEVCTQRVKALCPADNRRVFTRAFGFGLLAALASGLAMVAMLESFPRMFSVGGEFFAGWAVGWCIAKAMHTGSRGALGRKYQIAGSLLAYAAMIYSVQGYIMGFREASWWIYPFALLRPIAFLVTNMREIGGAELLAAFIAMTRTWRGLRGGPNPVRAV